MSPFQRLAAALAAFRGRVHPALPMPPVLPAVPSRPAAQPAIDAAALRRGLLAQADAAAEMRASALAEVAKLDAATNALGKP